QDAGLEQALGVDVVAVLGAPGRLIRPVEARELLANHAAFFRPGICHGLALLPFAAQCGNGVAHLLVSPATADVAGQAALDFLRRGVRVLVEGGTEGDDEPGRAKAALLSVRVDKGRRYCIELAVFGKRLGGPNLTTARLQGEDGARVDRLAVE